jgi:hypothetical protein
MVVIKIPKDEYDLFLTIKSDCDYLIWQFIENEGEVTDKSYGELFFKMNRLMKKMENKCQTE